MASGPNDTTVISTLVLENTSSQPAKFATLLALQIPSFGCFLFLLYHLLFDRTLRRELYNHVMIALLIIGFMTVVIDLPMILTYLHTGISPATSSLGCLLWNFVDLSLYALVSILMLWASIERHILIFHDRFLNSRRRQYLIHYAPLFVIPVYVVVFYGVVVFAHPCQNAFDYTQVVCGILCYYNDTPWLAVIDQLGHNMIPAILITFLNVSLLVKIIWQKQHRMHRRVNWAHQRRMILQLLPVSLLYICGVMPYALLVCVHLLGGWSDVGVDLQGQFFYLFYLMTVLLPFVCLLGMPNLYAKLPCKRKVRIVPDLQVTNYHLRTQHQGGHAYLH